MTTKRQLERALLAVCQHLDPDGFLAIAQSALEDAREEGDRAHYTVTLRVTCEQTGMGKTWTGLSR